MIETSVLVTYIVIVAGFVFVPGPATLLAMARATHSGTRAGLATAAGIAVGDVLHTCFAVIGLSAIVLASAQLFLLVKYLGAAYLVYLGFRVLFAPAQEGQGRGRSQICPGRAFRQAIVLELLNPKTALFFIAFLPQFVAPENGAVIAQLMVFGAIQILLGFVATVIFAVVAGELTGTVRAHPVFRQWLNRVVGSVYLTLGVRLAFQER